MGLYDLENYKEDGHNMKYPQFFKKIIIFIIISQLLLSAKVFADEQIKIIIIPVKGSFDISEGDVKQVTKVVGNSFCDIGSTVWLCLDRDAGLRAMLDEAKLSQQGVTVSNQAIQLGKAQGANFALIVTIGKLSSGSHTLNTQLIHLESGTMFPIGVSEIKPTIDGLFDYANNQLGPALIAKFKGMSGSNQSSNKCQDLKEDTIAKALGDCVKDGPFNDKEAKCFGSQLQNSCNNINSDSSCSDRCLKNALILTKQALTEIAKEECEKKGGKVFDGECKNTSSKLNPSDSKKTNTESDHSGWASWFIPGLGLGLKNRPGWGLFFFGATYITYGYYVDKLQEYKNKKQEYESVIPVPFPYNFGLAGNYLYYDTRYSAYKDATNGVSNAVNLFAAVYIAQVFFSYTMNANQSFSSQFNDRLIVGNSSGKKIYLLNSSTGAIIDSIAIAQPPTGLVYFQNYLWVLYTDKRIYKYTVKE